MRPQRAPRTPSGAGRAHLMRTTGGSALIANLLANWRLKREIKETKAMSGRLRAELKRRQAIAGRAGESHNSTAASTGRTEDAGVVAMRVGQEAPLQQRRGRVHARAPLGLPSSGSPTATKLDTSGSTGTGSPTVRTPIPTMRDSYMTMASKPGVS